MINLTFVFLVVIAFIVFAIVSVVDNPKALLDFFFSKKDDVKYKKICPKCGSTNIAVDFSNMVVWASGTPPKYACKYCGHISITFPEVEKDNLKLFADEFRNLSQEGGMKAIKEDKFDIKSGYSVGLIEAYLMGSVIAGMLIIYFLINS